MLTALFIACWVCGWSLCVGLNVQQCHQRGFRVSLWRVALLAAVLFALWPFRLPDFPIGRGE